ncbi:MAG: phosphoribosylformylglycinamidine synthase subunit PurS, partial [Phycisphaerae bacterium]
MTSNLLEDRDDLAALLYDLISTRLRPVYPENWKAPMIVLGFEIRTKDQFLPSPEDRQVLALLREAGLAHAETVRVSRRYFLEGAFEEQAALRVAQPLLHEAILEHAEPLKPAVAQAAENGTKTVEIHLKPGVMDPAAASIREELRASGLDVESVRTARRLEVSGNFEIMDLVRAVCARLANDCIEDVLPGSAGVQPAPRPPTKPFDLRHVAIRDLDEDALTKLSRDGSLFLSLAEMKTIQAHFRELDRDPTDLELETLAQTWSEHCVHKTLKSAVRYCGAAFPGSGARREETIEASYQNLLKDTIAKSTQTLIELQRGPECLSVFVDNAGIIGFDENFGVAIKVETHNHPSAIEPYGGAATGIGGCIRDVVGCGLGAWPFASTDVFCVAPTDWPEDELPKGVLHPQRVLRGVVQGVADYGNRMGIPTVNGAVDFDLRFLANPLVYCGCIGLIPRDKVKKEPRAGDLIVVLGGRTGRDGIHGATFSSAEMTDTHTDEFSHAVQIGNAIEEKRALDAIMRARDHADGCLFTAITDCGAGGLSSAIGEMGEHVGAMVELEKVPLKYEGLRYDEIWISEAQERFVLAVPPPNIEKFMECARAEGSEATVIGKFGLAMSKESLALDIKFNGTLVGALSMNFLHNGIPGTVRDATWTPPTRTDQAKQSTKQAGNAETLDRLRAHLARPEVASKNWIVRKYDHEVQGGSVVKPFMGLGRGPCDAAVVRPVLTSDRAVAIGCGLQRSLADIDPYWMAANAIDEAVRNVVCVGG